MCGVCGVVRGARAAGPAHQARQARRRREAAKGKKRMREEDHDHAVQVQVCPPSAAGSSQRTLDCLARLPLAASRTVTPSAVPQTQTARGDTSAQSAQSAQSAYSRSSGERREKRRSARVTCQHEFDGLADVCANCGKDSDGKGGAVKLKDCTACPGGRTGEALMMRTTSFPTKLPQYQLDSAVVR